MTKPTFNYASNMTAVPTTHFSKRPPLSPLRSPARPRWQLSFCGSSRTEPFAASIEGKKGSANAVIDGEPAHEYDAEGKRSDYGEQGQAVAPCPVNVKLSWNGSIAFVREAIQAACPDITRARSLSISDCGCNYGSARDRCGGGLGLSVGEFQPKSHRPHKARTNDLIGTKTRPDRRLDGEPPKVNASRVSAYGDIQGKPC